MRGAWHYFHPKVDAIKQAVGFLAVVQEQGLLTSDKLIIDFENTDGMTDLVSVMKAAASFYYEVHKACPKNEFVMYTGYYFWMDMLIAGADGSWAKDLPLWEAWYPRDPTPGHEVPIFAGATFEQLKADIQAGRYTIKIPTPWKKLTYWQFSAYVDSHAIPGHPAIKKVVDVNFAPEEVQEFPTPETPPPPVPGVLFKVQVTSYVLNIRSSISGTIVGQAKFGDVLDVYEEKSGWYRIGDGKWVYAFYTTKNITAPTFPINYKVNVAALNVRTGPDVSYAIAGPPLPFGTVVSVLGYAGAQNDWAKLAVGKYCYLPYLVKV